MRNLRRIFLGLFVGLFAMSANAVVIDTTSTWSGNVNSGWLGSGQSFTIDSNDTFFDDVTFSFDALSNGRTFNFLLSDALNGGNTLFSTSFVVSSGLGLIDINTNLVGGSSVYALIDYNGYSGSTAYFQDNVYAGGSSIFSNSSNSSFVQFDHVFVANFTDPNQSNQIPEPASLALLGLGLAGIGFSRKKKKV